MKTIKRSKKALEMAKWRLDKKRMGWKRFTLLLPEDIKNQVLEYKNFLMTCNRIRPPSAFYKGDVFLETPQVDQSK